MLNNKIRLSKSVVGDREKQALADVIDESYLGMGRFVKKFEEKLKEFIGAKHVVCVNSGTAALHLALASIGLNNTDEVLVQSLTFVACFQAITAAGAKPVACEVDPQTCSIDLEDAEKKITSNTKAIMPIHYAGGIANIEETYALAEKHNLRVIEDAAHAFGSTHKSKKIGSFGDIICFSFDGIKNITSGEGGAIVTNDNAIAQYIMDARLLGVERDTQKRYLGLRSWEFDVTHQGYRYHMSNLFAAIGIAQLERFETEFKPVRQKLAKKYQQELSNQKDIVLFNNNFDETVPHIYPMRVLQNKRDGLRKHLLNHDVECGIHYLPNHLLTYFGNQRGALPITEQMYNELLTLPLHPELTDADQDYVIQTVKEYIS